MDSIEYVGLVASALATLAFLPQVVTTWGTRSADDFSVVTLLMLEAGASLWICYGVWREAPAIWLGNGVTASVGSQVQTFLPLLEVPPSAFVMGAAIAVALGVLSCALPCTQIWRLSVVEQLRRT